MRLRPAAILLFRSMRRLSGVVALLTVVGACTGEAPVGPGPGLSRVDGPGASAQSGCPSSLPSRTDWGYTNTRTFILANYSCSDLRVQINGSIGTTAFLAGAMMYVAGSACVQFANTAYSPCFEGYSSPPGTFAPIPYYVVNAPVPDTIKIRLRNKVIIKEWSRTFIKIRTKAAVMGHRG